MKNDAENDVKNNAKSGAKIDKNNDVKTGGEDAPRSEQKATEAVTSKAIIDWLESMHTLHVSVQGLYVVDGYEVSIYYDDNPVYTFHGKTLFDAFKSAMAVTYDTDSRKFVIGDQDDEPTPHISIDPAQDNDQHVESEVRRAVMSDFIGKTFRLFSHGISGGSLTAYEFKHDGFRDATLIGRADSPEGARWYVPNKIPDDVRMEILQDDGTWTPAPMHVVSMPMNDVDRHMDDKLSTFNDKLESLRANTKCTMGVGTGDGQLFVYGSHDAIKAAQKIVLERDDAVVRVGEIEKVLREQISNLNHTSLGHIDRLVFSAKLNLAKQLLVDFGFEPPEGTQNTILKEHDVLPTKPWPREQGTNDAPPRPFTKPSVEYRWNSNTFLVAFMILMAFGAGVCIALETWKL